MCGCLCVCECKGPWRIQEGVRSPELGATGPSSAGNQTTGKAFPFQPHHILSKPRSMAFKQDFLYQNDLPCKSVVSKAFSHIASCIWNTTSCPCGQSQVCTVADLLCVSRPQQCLGLDVFKPLLPSSSVRMRVPTPFSAACLFLCLSTLLTSANNKIPRERERESS